MKNFISLFIARYLSINLIKLQAPQYTLTLQYSLMNSTDLEPRVRLYKRCVPTAPPGMDVEGQNSVRDKAVDPHWTRLDANAQNGRREKNTQRLR